MGRISRNPVDAADPPRTEGDGTKEMQTWTREQLKAFLEAVADDRLYGLWHTLAMTGMRHGEAIGLRCSDVDLENGSSQSAPLSSGLACLHRLAAAREQPAHPACRFTLPPSRPARRAR